MWHPNRRTFLKTALGAAVVLRQDNLTIHTVGGSNVLALKGADGVVLVDGGAVENSAALLQGVGGRVTTLFNTHWHPEQTGSNIAVRNAGGTVIAHENTRLWLSTDITRPWEKKTFQPMPKEGRPNKTFYTTGSMNANGERIDYGYMLQAHTDGDIYVYFSKANVLALGGLTAANAWPLIDWWTGGWIGGLPNGLDAAVKVANAQTKIVPASGPVMTYADLQAHAQMYRSISTKIQQLMRSGRSRAEALAAEPTKEFNAKLGDPKEFVERAYESCWAQLTPDA